MTQNTLIFSFATAGVIFIIIEIVLKLLRKRKIQAETKEEMIKRDLSYTEAKDNMLLKKIANIMKIDKDTLKISDSQEIKQGDRVSFNTYKYGYITGDFIGSKSAMANGYTEILIVRITDGKILQAPIEYIMVDTINVYGR